LDINILVRTRFLFQSSAFSPQLFSLIKSVLTKEWYINILVRIRINVFRAELAVSSYEDLLSAASASVSCDASVGNAIYMLPSFYNHDCGMGLHILILRTSDTCHYLSMFLFTTNNLFIHDYTKLVVSFY
jgi:hypothetical protein